MKTDSNGNFLWEKTYNSAKDLGVRIDVTHDNGFILGGGVRDRISDHQDAYIIKTDSAGNMEWDKTYGTPGNDCGGGAYSTSDGGYIMTSCLDTIINLQNTRGPYYLAKLDSQGNIVWRTIFGISDEHYLLMVRELPNGYICAGSIEDGLLNEKRVGWVIKLDLNGNILWDKRYAHVRNLWGIELANSELLDIQPTNDGGFVTVGQTFETNTSDFWVLKLDSNGCMGNYCGLTDTNCYYQPYPDCDDTVGVGEVSNIEHQDVRLLVYPNPANDVVYFHPLSRYAAIEQIRLFDAQGRIIIESRNTNQLNIEDFPGGIYYYEVVIDDAMLPSQRQYPTRGKIIKH